MAIVIVSRWKGNYEQALPILRKASPIMKDLPIRLEQVGLR